MPRSNNKVLIADDEPDIFDILKYNLEKEGYDVITAGNGDEALRLAKENQPQLIVLDMMMPIKNGIEVCERLRAIEAFKKTFIIFLTAINDDATQVKSFITGADDYISKPVSPSVFVSKINAFFRRITPTDENTILVDGLTIDKEKFQVTYQETNINLAKKEFELLYLLASKPGKVFLRNEILDRVWGNEVIVGDRTIDVHIRKIRQKMNVDCIKTIKGIGYKFEF